MSLCGLHMHISNKVGAHMALGNMKDSKETELPSCTPPKSTHAALPRWVTSTCILVPLQADDVGAGLQYVLKHGRTATSLSVPGHLSAGLCVYDAMKVLRLQGLTLHGLRDFLPKLEQITISGQCLASDPMSRATCRGCLKAFVLHLGFKSLLSNVRVCSFSSSTQVARSASRHFMQCKVAYIWELTREVVHCRW